MCHFQRIRKQTSDKPITNAWKQGSNLSLDCWRKLSAHTTSETIARKDTSRRVITNIDKKWNTKGWQHNNHKLSIRNPSNRHCTADYAESITESQHHRISESDHASQKAITINSQNKKTKKRAEKQSELRRRAVIALICPPVSPLTFGNATYPRMSVAPC